MRYDSTSVPERYHRSRALAAADVRHWVSHVRGVMPHGARNALIDLGCGTGRFSVPLAEHLGVPVVGVDPSRRMLEEAERSRDLDRALREMARVLEPDGIVFLRNYSRENLNSLYYLQFFPEASSVSRDMIWPRGTVAETFTARGFALLSQGTVRQEASPDFEASIRKIRSWVYSDLALIPDDAFHRGMTGLEAARGSWGGGPIMEDLDYFVFRCGR